MSEELPKGYDPHGVETKWRKHWRDEKTFTPDPDAPGDPYSIVIPPPNVTGVLHMGHMLNNTIQDILIRRARMEGKNALWVPGTDHASIATEAKVVARLAERGIKKSELSRDEFLRYAWEWKDEHGGIILEQLKKLGASCDWSRTAFTMDETRSKSVIHVFVDLYNKGLIYRGVRMVNWDPAAQTALSDEEVVYKEEHGKLYYLRYKIVGEDGYAIVATTRPETIMGDTAMCINPNDPKNAHLKGKKVIVPLVNREIPVIEDEYVDIEFGTGCLKVTPAHDVNDYMLGEKYNLPSIDIFNDNGTLSEAAGLYVGLDRFEVRKRIEADLAAAGLLEKVEAYTNKVGHSERTNAVIEPKLSMQWFLIMDKISKPALEAVMNDDVKFHPAKFKNVYRHWMENVKDWCISRQLWWGHRIPAYFLPKGGYVVAETPEEALALAREKAGDETLRMEDLRQDEDVLDTWFSSWLWPISLFDGIKNPGNEEIKYYYPTSDLVTAPDIIFFWVARMIIAGYEYMGEKPFRNVYFTGIVRDKLGRKMSKSLGNSPDPLMLIEKYGADGVRMGLMLAAPAGNDILYDDALCEQGRNFNNKIWNAFRLVKSWNVGDVPQPESAAMAVDWFDAVLNKALAEVADLFGKFRLSEALMTVYKLFWDEFSSWYLEMVKPAYGAPIDRTTCDATLRYFDVLLRLLHPFMPFITEELWQHLAERKEGESIMYASLPVAGQFDEHLLSDMDVAKEIIAGVRTVRLQKNLPNKETLPLQVVGGKASVPCVSVVKKMANLSDISESDTKDATSVSFLVGTVEYAVPLGGNIDIDAELKKLESELAYNEGFLQSVLKKLGNEKFVNNAPAKVIEMERKKQSDAEAKIAMLKESISALKSKK